MLDLVAGNRHDPAQVGAPAFLGDGRGGSQMDVGPLLPCSVLTTQPLPAPIATWPSSLSVLRVVIRAGPDPWRGRRETSARQIGLLCTVPAAASQRPRSVKNGGYFACPGSAGSAKRDRRGWVRPRHAVAGNGWCPARPGRTRPAVRRGIPADLTPRERLPRER